MRQFLPGLLARQATAAALSLALFGLAAMLGIIALGCAAYAVFHHLLPLHGPAVAAWITGAIFLVTAAVAATLGWYRLRRALLIAPEPRPGPEPQPRKEPTPDIAHLLASLVQEQLPKHAVPASLLALLAGIIVGLNPEVARTLAETFRRKPS